MTVMPGTIGTGRGIKGVKFSFLFFRSVMPDNRQRGSIRKMARMDARLKMSGMTGGRLRLHLLFRHPPGC